MKQIASAYAFAVLLVAGCSGVSSTEDSVHQASGPIRVAAVGADLGRRAAYQILEEGDLQGSVTHVEWSDFNHLSARELHDQYDVVLFTWVTTDRLNADFERRLAPFLEQGGGILFEDPGNTADLAPVAVAASKFPYMGTFTLTDVPGLTSSVTSEFPHNHIAWIAWETRTARLPSTPP